MQKSGCWARDPNAAAFGFSQRLETSWPVATNVKHAAAKLFSIVSANALRNSSGSLSFPDYSSPAIKQ